MHSKKVKRPNIVQVFSAFRAIDGVLSSLKETGEVATINGDPCFVDNRGDWQEIGPSLRGWCSLWEILSVRHMLDMDFSVIRKVARMLDAGSPITRDDVARCITVVDGCRKAYRMMDVREVASLAKTQQIKMEIGNVTKN